MNKPYEPRAGSVPAGVIGYLRNHPRASLTVEQIVDMFCDGRRTSNVHTLLADAIDTGAVVRDRNAEDEYIYRVGPNMDASTNADAASPAAPRKRKSSGDRRVIDTATLQICTDPMPTKRVSPVNKYDAIFSQLEVGQCIKCESRDAFALSKALQHWLKRTKSPHIARSQTRYDDGMGRVWLLAGTPDAHALQAQRLKLA